MTLADLARRSGWSPSDVAFLAGVEESTISRLWHAEDWLDRIKGKTLRALIATVPGVGEFLTVDTLKRRRSELVDQLADVDLEIDIASMQRLVVSEGIAEQLLANALTAALHVTLQQPREAIKYLARFWGRSQDGAFCRLWSDASSGGVFVDTKPLVRASISLAQALRSELHSFHAIVGHATLLHYIARATGHKIHMPSSSSIGRGSAMPYRSSAIGHILQSSDVEAARHYQSTVSESSLLGMVEGWSFPTYNRDAVVTKDFSLPGSVLLRHTARELLNDLNTENEAYFYYLVKTAVPRMLRQDPTLGLRAAEIASEIQDREERLLEAPARQAAGLLISQLQRSA